MTQITLRVRQTLKESSLLTHEETEEQRGYGICLKPHSELVAELEWFLCPRATGPGAGVLSPCSLLDSPAGANLPLSLQGPAGKSDHLGTAAGEAVVVKFPLEVSCVSG